MLLDQHPLIIVLIYIISFIVMYIVKRVINNSGIKFIFAGGLNTLNYAVLYWFFLTYITYSWAHILAFIGSMLLSYVVTSVYTFETKMTLQTFIKFPLTTLPNFIMSTFGTIVLVETGILPENIASIFLMIAIIPVTYIVTRLVMIGKK